jgi:hypothetical protein
MRLSLFIPESSLLSPAVLSEVRIAFLACRHDLRIDLWQGDGLPRLPL